MFQGEEGENGLTTSIGDDIKNHNKINYKHVTEFGYDKSKHVYVVGEKYVCICVAYCIHF